MTVPTPEEVRAMPAGEELDIIVAELVCGWKWMRYYDLDYRSPDGPFRRTLCDPNGGWLTPPKYVECDFSKQREINLIPHYYGPCYSSEWSAFGPLLESCEGNFEISFSRKGLLDVSLYSEKHKPIHVFWSQAKPNDLCRAIAIARVLAALSEGKK